MSEAANDVMKGFALDLYNWRQEHGYNQAEAGKFMGVSGALISLYERGKCIPPVGRWEQMMQIMGKSTAPEAAKEPQEEAAALTPILKLPQTRPMTFRERMEMRDREQGWEHYTQKTKEIVAEREQETESRAAVKVAHVDDIMCAAGFLEGLQCALNIDKDTVQKYVTALLRIVEEVKDNDNCA